MSEPPDRSGPTATPADRLHETAAHLRLFVEQAPIAVAMVDRELRYLAVSRRWMVDFQLAERSILGVSHYDVFPEARARWGEIHERALAGSVVWANEERFERADGTVLWLRWQVRPWTFDDGTIGGVILCAEDLTELKRAEQSARASEGKLTAIVNAAVDGVVVIDERGRIDSVNPAVERMFQRSAAELVGQNVSVLMPSPYREEHDVYVRAYLDTGKARIIGAGRETLALRADGTTFPVHLSVGEFRLGDERMFTGVIRDLTAFHVLQEELVQTRSLASLGKAAAALSHELKNPLAAIKGVIEVVRDTLPGDDHRRGPLGGAIDQVTRLDGFVRQLLHLTRPWPVQARRTDLVELARAVAQAAARDPQFAGVRFEFEAPGSVARSLDPGMVHQVLLNLYQNAAQAMEGGGTIRVAIGEERGGVRIVVRDNGAGIPPEVQARLFELFYSTKTAGSGLGLSVCRKVMETHGGTIDIRSALGEGTEVTLRFPRERMVSLPPVAVR